MLFVFISIFVPVMIYTLLPYVLQRLKVQASDTYKPLLFVGCILFFVSWYLPSPLINGQDTAFTTHLVGGGIFSGFIWLYILKSTGQQLTALYEIVSLFAFVSSLGVLNELAELLLVTIRLAHLSLTDTSWDLFANTVGALVFFVVYKICRFSSNNHTYQNMFRRGSAS